MAGVVLVAAGLVLGYVPVEQTPSNAQQMIDPGNPSRATLVIGPPPVAYLSPSLGYRVHWSTTGANSSTPLNSIGVYDCGSSEACSNWSPGNSTEVVSEHGSNGTLSWTGHPGQFFLIYATAPADLAIGYSGPLLGGLAGWLLIGVGAVLIALGVLARARPPPPKDDAPDEPTAVD